MFSQVFSGDIFLEVDTLVKGMFYILKAVTNLPLKIWHQFLLPSAVQKDTMVDTSH